MFLIDENYFPSLKIQDMFIDGSVYLYLATRQRLFFRNVTIIIPSSWSSKPEYDPPGKYYYDRSDVIVAPPNTRWAPDPYTEQFQGCGKPGRFIHFMDDIFRDIGSAQASYGNLGR